MIQRLLLALLCLLAPLSAGADGLEVYGDLIGKAVLRPATLPPLGDSITENLPKDKTNAVAAIEQALARRGLEVLQDGPHFVRVFPKNDQGFLTNAPLRGRELATRKDREALPTGMVDFQDADLAQILDIYTQLSQRTVLRPATLPAPTFKLRSRGAVSREEVLYAMATLLALNGICVVEDGAKFVQVVPISQRAAVKTRAPKPEPDARLFDPRKVPATGGHWTHAPLSEKERLEQEFERLRSAFYDFLHVRQTTRPAGRRLFELYARLAGKTAVPSPKFDGMGIWFHVETPLTRRELLYAIETTFALNNVAIIPVEDDKVRLGHISELLKNTGGRLDRVPREP